MVGTVVQPGMRILALPGLRVRYYAESLPQPHCPALPCLGRWQTVVVLSTRTLKDSLFPNVNILVSLVTH